MSRSIRTAVVLLTAVIALLPLARADEGSGGPCFICASPVTIGGTYSLEWGSPGATFAPYLLLVSDGIGPTVFSGVTVCLDLASPGFSVAQTSILDVNGRASAALSIPNIPGLAGLAPAYILAVVVQGGQVCLSKTMRIDFENPDSYTSTLGMMSQTRALHRSVALQQDCEDNRTRVLVCGGGIVTGGDIFSPVTTTSVDLYSPLTRTFSPAAPMSLSRAFHTATRLADGRVLVCGGADDVGAVNNQAELYDPATNAWTSTGSMTSPRAGHQATLLANGMVLVTGGVTTFAGASTSLGAVLGTAQSSAEIFDPMTGLWTAVVGAMSSPRVLHSQTALANGDVLVTGGVSGSTSISILGSVIVLPTYTASADVFSPATGFTPTGNMTISVAGHATSVLGNGDVLATGGFRPGSFMFPTAISTCQRWNGATWAAVANLPTSVAFHDQVATANGNALVVGGATGTLDPTGLFPAFQITPVANVVRHTGTTATALSAIGTSPSGGAASPRAGLTVTQTFDGAYAVIGGFDGTGSLASAFVYTP